MTRQALVETVASVAKPGDLVVGLGAGTITDWINALAEQARAASGSGLERGRSREPARRRLPELRGKLKAEAPRSRTSPGSGPAARRKSSIRPPTRPTSLISCKRTPADIPVTVIGLGSNLLVRDGGIAGVVIRLGRGFGEIKIEEGLAAPRRRRRARCEGGARRGRCRHRRPLLLSRHPRLRRRRAAHEWRRAWPRDERGAGRGARRRPPGRHPCAARRRAPLRLSPLRRARGLHLHRGAVPGRARRPRRDPRRDGRHRRLSRGGAADQEPHRRLDLQEPARARRPGS